MLSRRTAPARPETIDFLTLNRSYPTLVISRQIIYRHIPW